MTHGHKPKSRTGMVSGLRRSLREPSGRTGRGGRDIGAIVVVAAMVLLISTMVVVRLRRHTVRSPEPSTSPEVLLSTPDTKWDERWTPLAVTGFPARPLEAIKRAYAFAARRPDILRSMPCYCGCKRLGHESNEACYVKSRSSTGQPRWTDHAITCGICIDITLDAAVMTADQKPIDTIRRAIETKYQER